MGAPVVPGWGSVLSYSPRLGVSWCHTEAESARPSLLPPSLVRPQIPWKGRGRRVEGTRGGTSISSSGREWIRTEVARRTWSVVLGAASNAEVIPEGTAGWPGRFTSSEGARMSPLQRRLHAAASGPWPLSSLPVHHPPPRPQASLCLSPPAARTPPDLWGPVGAAPAPG